MYDMSADELLLVAKIFAHVMGNPTVAISDLDKESAKVLIKKMADQRYDWAPNQKDTFKKFVDLVVK